MSKAHNQFKETKEIKKKSKAKQVEMKRSRYTIFIEQDVSGAHFLCGSVWLI